MFTISFRPCKYAKKVKDETQSGKQQKKWTNEKGGVQKMEWE